MLFGTPGCIAEKIQEMKDKLNLKPLLLWSNFPGVAHGAVVDSITMFTERVMPLFAEEAE
ncbi:MAG TPA: hypothetical protein QF905_06465, partial [Acidimicrobiales bacterium]|nr:hypothetical protein [Acidimicrobiales bacterium]